MSVAAVVAKGAIVVAGTGLPTFLFFQYNPDTVTRSLKPAIQGGERGSHSEAVRLSGPPVETIDLEVQFDASTAPLSAAVGIAPYLAALEVIAYPSTTTLVKQAAELAAGTIEVEPAPAPLVLFSWGVRLIPVQIDSWSVTEQAFDRLLIPMRATVRLQMRVLSADDIAPSHPGYKYYLFYQKSKEALSNVAIASFLNMVPR